METEDKCEDKLLNKNRQVHYNRPTKLLVKAYKEK